MTKIQTIGFITKVEQLDPRLIMSSRKSRDFSHGMDRLP